MGAGIRQLHWNVLPAEIAPQALPGYEVVVAVWPAPVDADACFRDAGFADFADSDDTWDRQWQEVIERAFRSLEPLGLARLSKGIEVYEICKSGLIRQLIEVMGLVRPPMKRVPLSVLEQVFVASDDDQFGDVLVDFGLPAKASLSAGSGHPILWVGLRGQCGLTPEILVEGLAENHPITRTSLKWEMLIPRRDV